MTAPRCRYCGLSGPQVVALIDPGRPAWFICSTSDPDIANACAERQRVITEEGTVPDESSGFEPEPSLFPYRPVPDKPEPSEWPPRDQINWNLLQELAQKPHPLLKPGGSSGDTSDLHYSVVEVLHEALTVHHLLDMAGVPRGYSVDTTSIDCRTLIAIIGMGNLRERLDRISGWHARETGPAGTVGDFCTECGRRWPCDSRRMADGTYVDEDEPVTESP